MPAYAHGTTISVSRPDHRVHLTPSDLQASLGATRKDFDLSAITQVSTTAPTALIDGEIFLHGPDIAITFAPGQKDAAEQLARDLTAIIAGGSAPSLIDGDTTTGEPIPGFNFVALDVETANADNGSICQIGLARVINGHIVETFSSLCTPPGALNHFEEGNINIHGIHPEDVANAEDFATVWQRAAEFIGDALVVSHYVQFDATAVSRALDAAGITTAPLTTACSLALSRATDVGQERNGLKPMCAALGIDLRNHHDAEADAVACAEIFIRLARKDNFTGSAHDYFHHRGFTLGGVDGSLVTPVLKDIDETKIPAQRNELGLAPLPGMDPTPTQKPAQKKTSGGRKRPAWAKARTPDTIPEPNPTPDENSPFINQVVVFTGDFGDKDKGELWAKVAALGGQVAKNVTKKTTMLILGAWEGVTTKQKRAEELIAKGQDIHLISGDELLDMLGAFPEVENVGVPATATDGGDGFTPEDLTPPF
ncbi:exonuclease domain-containing protein [Corynebacterium aquilae]|uniref:exonuclease domain-containing protein n=1 Tax=Corynebacterium aquilae TaxID=203263 RepID=UPI000951C64A|nr:exonuclease domain-containing protein [Corynebacterium aquilae]